MLEEAANFNKLPWYFLNIIYIYISIALIYEKLNHNIIPVYKLFTFVIFFCF